MTIYELYTIGKNILHRYGVSDYQSETLHIIEHCFNMKKHDILLNKSKIVESYEFFYIVSQRLTGRPLQYILGYWWFMGIKLKIGEGLLIPRGDTELLVRETIKLVKNRKDIRIIDLCSGSGAIAVGLSFNLDNIDKIFAMEFSKNAYKYLVYNCNLYSTQIMPLLSDVRKDYNMFENNTFDVIISNPPYIPTNDIDFLDLEVQHEPKIALNGGHDGLDFYRNICKNWYDKLKIGGIFAFEIGIGQSEKVSQILSKNKIKNIKVFKDFQNIDRVIIGEK